MALGEQLKRIRVARNLTQKDVASATGMTVTMVDSIEREDFSRTGAPFYARGFIKMYANFLCVDPQPFIDEYMQRFGQQKTISDLSDSQIIVKSERQQSTTQYDSSSQKISRPVSFVGDLMRTFLAVLKNCLIQSGAQLIKIRKGLISSISRVGICLKRSIRLILLLIGVGIIIVFVVSALANLVRKGKNTWLYKWEKPHRLQVSEDPPSPYFE